MHSDLEKLVARGKIEEVTGEQLDAVPPGTFVVHKSWGAGKVKEWDRLNLKVIVDFEGKPDHALGMKFAGLSLTPVEEGTFYAQRFADPDGMKDMAKADSPSLVKMALEQNDRKLFLDQLEQMVKGTIVDEGKYKSWWDSTKKKLRQDRQFVVPSKRTEPLQLREEGGEPSDDLINDFREARDLKAKVGAVETIIKDLNVFDEPAEALGPIVSEISDAAKRGVKLQFVPAIELILSREELASKLKGFKTPEEEISIADLLASEKGKIPELLETLSLTRMRQILKAFPTAFKDEWINEMLGQLPQCNLRSTTEIANFLAKEKEEKSFVDYMANGLQQRSLSSDALAWICRERDGMAKDLIDPSLSLSVISSLEASQLNEDGAVRVANRLRDLLSDDQQLIPDLIADANINTIRNFSSRLVTCAAFDELTRKSLMARIIKMHPEVQDLVGQRERKQEDEILIVSEQSLVDRKAAFDKLVKEEIPQNREDIKIARSYGDLRENFEYKSAKDYQRVLLKRQDDWERDLKLANPTDFGNPDTSQVSIGTVVNLDSTQGGESLTYTVLGAWDSDPDKGIIPYLSKRGSLMLEKKVGEVVSMPTSDGNELEYKITGISAYKS